MQSESKEQQTGTKKALSAKAAAVGTATAALGISRSAHAAGSDILKIGFIGCGNRGTGAASQALNADPNVKLHAMADLFEDRLELSLTSLRQQPKIRNKIDVPKERKFIGIDGYQKVLDSDVDVVILSTPPQFRPAHIKAAVDKGVHVFAEKPVAVDAPGVRSVLQSCEEAKKKNLAVVSGLALRYSYGFRETVKRIHDGALGDIHTLQSNDYRGSIWFKPRQPDWTDMHWQLRNWYYFTWLSGDFIVEQHIHFLDVCAWIMGDKYPAKAVALGGRQTRTGTEYGHIYDHFSTVYEYEDGTKLFSNCRQMPRCKNNVSSLAMGSKGAAKLSERRKGLWIDTDSKWFYDGEENRHVQTEHDELFASIRSGNVINNGRYMTLSTLLAILGREAAYTGQEITWDQMMNSKADLTPKSYDWGEIATPPIAVPGVTKFS